MQLHPVIHGTPHVKYQCGNGVDLTLRALPTISPLALVFEREMQVETGEMKAKIFCKLQDLARITEAAKEK